MSFAKKINAKLLRRYFKYKDGYFIRIRQIGNAPVGAVVMGSKHHLGYRNQKFFNKTYLFHRLVWVYHFGDTNLQVDHIDNNKNNNRIENLRLATPSQNQANIAVKKGKLNKHKNVYFCKVDKLYYVSIQVKGIRKKYGYTKNINSAIKTRNEKVKELFGEYGKY